MDIDLLFNNYGEAGLVSSQNLVKKAAGVLLDTMSGILSLEYVASMHLFSKTSGEYDDGMGDLPTEPGRRPQKPAKQLRRRER